MDAERLEDLFENARQIREQARRVVAQSHQLCIESEKFTSLKNPRREPRKNPREDKARSTEKRRG